MDEETQIDPEVDALELRDGVIHRSRELIGSVSQAFNEPWKANPSTGVRAALGHWIMNSVRHLAAISILCEEHDLSTVAEVHYRQILEIMLQVRYFLAFDPNERDLVAQRVSAFGCLDFLDKLENLKDNELVKSGYEKAKEQLSTYELDIVEAARKDRESRQLYWFGRTFSWLADQVSRGNEDYRGVYRITSGEIHGSWALTFGLANPAAGFLDFSGYPDKTTLYRWSAELVDRATLLYVETWNEISRAVDAPGVTV
jgi:hypothetical protein